MPDPCVYHLLKRCKHGDSCHFSHDISAILQQALTHASITTSIGSGDNTKHSDGKLLDPATATLRKVSKGQCLFYKQGKCKHGKRCKFSHSESATKSTLACVFFQQGKCRNGAHCPFSHDVRSGVIGQTNAMQNTRKPHISDGPQTWNGGSVEGSDFPTETSAAALNDKPQAELPAAAEQLITEASSHSDEPSTFPPCEATPDPSSDTNLVDISARDTSEGASSAVPARPDTEITLTESSALASSNAAMGPRLLSQDLSPLGTPFRRFTIEGTCGNAENCSSHHTSTEGIIYQESDSLEIPSGASANSELCKYYAQGNCRRGNNCWFRHNGSQLFDKSSTYSSAPPPSTSDTPQPAQNRWTGVATKPCRFFADKKCLKGDSCTFLHSTARGDGADSLYLDEFHPRDDPRLGSAAEGDAQDNDHGAWGHLNNVGDSLDGEHGNVDFRNGDSSEWGPDSGTSGLDKGKTKEISTSDGWGTSAGPWTAEPGTGWDVAESIKWDDDGGGTWGNNDTSDQPDKPTGDQDIDYGNWGKMSLSTDPNLVEEQRGWGDLDDGTPWSTAVADTSRHHSAITSWGMSSSARTRSRTRKDEAGFQLPKGACRRFIETGSCPSRTSCHYSHLPADRKSFVRQQKNKGHSAKAPHREQETSRDVLPHLKSQRQPKTPPPWSHVLLQHDPNAAKHDSLSVTDSLPEDKFHSDVADLHETCPSSGKIACSLVPTPAAVEAASSDLDPTESPSGEAFPYLDLSIPASFGADEHAIPANDEVGECTASGYVPNSVIPDAQDSKVLSHGALCSQFSHPLPSEVNETLPSASPAVQDALDGVPAEPMEVNHEQCIPEVFMAKTGHFDDSPRLDQTGNSGFLDVGENGTERLDTQPDIQALAEPPCVFEMASHPDSTHRPLFGCAVRFGKSALPEQIVTTFESRRLILSHLPFHVSVDDVCDLASEYGKITGLMLNPPMADNISALIEFSACEDAASAVQGLDCLNYRSKVLSARLDRRGVVENSNGDTRSRFVKLSWPAPSRPGWAYYDKITTAKTEAARLNGALYEGRKLETSFERPRKNQSHSFAVKIRGLPLDIDQSRLRNFCVGAATVHVGLPSFATVTGDQLYELLNPFGHVEAPDILPAEHGQTQVIAIAKFESADSAVHAVQGLSGIQPTFLGSQTMKCQQTYHSKYSITDRCQIPVIMPALVRLRDQLKAVVIQYCEYDNLTRVWLSGSNADAFVKAKLRLEAILHGEALIYQGKFVWDPYFETRRSESLFAKLNKDPSVYTYCNVLAKRINLVGDHAAKIQIKKQLMLQVSKLKNLTKRLPVRRELLRDLLENSMDAIRERVGAEKASLDIREACINFCGTPGDLQALRALLASLEASLPPLPALDPFSEWLRCPACSRKAKHPVQLPCSHTYCRTCMRHLIDHASSSTICCIKQLASDSDGSDARFCQAGIPYALITTLLSPEEEKILLEKSLLSHIRQPQSGYQLCPTPSCKVIYREGTPGLALECPECKIRICPACNTSFHDGLTCQDYQVLLGSNITA